MGNNFLGEFQVHTHRPLLTYPFFLYLVCGTTPTLLDNGIYLVGGSNLKSVHTMTKFNSDHQVSFNSNLYLTHLKEKKMR